MATRKMTSDRVFTAVQKMREAHAKATNFVYEYILQHVDKAEDKCIYDFSGADTFVDSISSSATLEELKIEKDNMGAPNLIAVIDDNGETKDMDVKYMEFQVLYEIYNILLAHQLHEN